MSTATMLLLSLTDVEVFPRVRMVKYDYIIYHCKPYSTQYALFENPTTHRSAPFQVMHPAVLKS